MCIDGIPTVSTDNYYGAVKHLLGHGCTRVAFVQGVVGLQESLDRQEGGAASETTGLSAHRVWSFPGTSACRQTSEAIREMHDRGLVPGVFFGNDDSPWAPCRSVRDRGSGFLGTSP